MVTPSAAAAANIRSAAAAVVLFSCAASPATARATLGWTRFAGTKLAGFSGRCLLTITQGLVGEVSEYCFGSREAADGGAAAAVVVDGAGAVGELADVLAEGAAGAVG